ncbi:UPF0472 protein C16orf72 homolog isoform X2 [Pseudoliparis swirei]|uniref:UPF0472 protein C16orf72 homolog isoform X2 n=1 Tax=Pseudoliparis swirei TaxID=2059687 RepID=UPI0024BD6D41|nr:UPF0472 protein C16orf72 homolog isoform X2 [Pseudoliparis swirei]
MEEKKEDGDSEIQEHGPEHWFSKWEQQCLAEAEQREPSEEEADNDQDKLWHLFQNSATAVAQLYKDRVCHQQGLSLWVPFQNSATAVTNLYKESAEAHQRSCDRGIQIGHQRRNKDMLAWVKKRRRTIRREDLISFLCGKAPPHRSSRANPWLAMVAPSRANSPAETGSSVETDLQPFREAIALHERRVLRQPDQKVRVLGRAEGEMDKQLISTSRFSDEVKVQNSLMTDELFQSVNMDVNEDFKGR